MSRTFSTIGVITGRDLIGDALIKLPFARALRHAFPTAKITWITSQGPTAFGHILREATHDLIDEVEEMPPWLEVKSRPQTAERSLPQHHNFGRALTEDPSVFFELLIDTRNRWREARLARKVPHRLFLAPAMRFLFSDKRPSLLGRRPLHLSERLLQLVELAAGYMPSSTGSLPVPEDLRLKALQILPKGPTYIGLAPGCSATARMWPLDRFEQVARAQIAKGRIPVFILGPLERDWYGGLRERLPSARFPLQEYAVWETSELGINHTLALGTCLDVAVGNDSGAGHILASVDCPIVSLFGPTTPLKAAPRSSRVISIRAETFGSAHMDAIPWEAVDQAIDQMLSHC